MATEIKFGKTLTLAQTANLIMHTPDNIIIVEGEPGVGKSCMLDSFAEHLPNHVICDPIDVPNLDLGDVAMPVVDREKMLTNYAPNSRFKLSQGKPVVMMLDEYAKGVEPVKNMLHPLFETKRRRLGDIYLEPGSIVFLTSNLSSDGVGDNLKMHSVNRLTRVKVRKPDADEWISWALNKNISPAVIAWVKEYPHALASYTDAGNKENPYIFNPTKVQNSYVSPRSLERASNILHVRQKLDNDTLIAALSGTVGEAAARDMQAHVAYQDQLPAWDDIIKNPKKAKVPDMPGACTILIYGAIMKVEISTINEFMTYLGRFEMEWQAAFAINVSKNKDKQKVAFKSKAFADWVQANEDLL